MDQNGFLEKGIKCEKCGKLLNENGQYPAELYAGTFTGLCYSCERKEPYQVSETSKGAKIMSHPPHCPSWRRDRERFIWREGCSFCHKGKIMISRSFAQGGSYPKQCEACSNEEYS